jgi:hypothetical protein
MFFLQGAISGYRCRLKKCCLTPNCKQRSDTIARSESIRQGNSREVLRNEFGKFSFEQGFPTTLFRKMVLIDGKSEF